MILTGIASWAHVTKAKPEFKTSKGSVIPSTYTIDLILDIEQAKKAKAAGLNVKRVKNEVSGIEDAVGQPYLTIKKAALFPDGNAAPAPIVVDSKLNAFTGLVGNGSKVNVVFVAKPWEGFGTTGVAASLRKVQVLELVEFGNKEALEDFSSEDGFVAVGSDAPIDMPESSTDISDDLDF